MTMLTLTEDDHFFADCRLDYRSKGVVRQQSFVNDSAKVLILWGVCWILQVSSQDRSRAASFGSQGT